MASVFILMYTSSITGVIFGRVLQGVGGAGVWSVGLALHAHNVNPERAGMLMGLAMLGFSIGNTASQSVGGSLYDKSGWLAPSYYALGIRE